LKNGGPLPGLVDIGELEVEDDADDKDDMDGQPDSTPKPLIQPFYTIDDFVRETRLPRPTVENWLARARRKRQLILQGPPGTGKTFYAERLAKLLVSNSVGISELVQFHPSYSYEDFIQGIRPRVDLGSLSYNIEPGRFLSFCDRASKVNGAPSVLIVDEINRANLSRVFGELMYLLEYRNKATPLAAGGKPFEIPANVYIIGTMNTADRSIALVDHALRRRFSFIYLEPDYEVLKAHLSSHQLPVDSLVTTLKTINAAIADRHYSIGISFFLADGSRLSSTLEDIWRGEIEPYLEEYFYDQEDKAKAFQWDALIKKELADWA
jgi:5-methylcytosine-specific restriction protein B